jgi:hypothetical protein
MLMLMVLSTTLMAEKLSIPSPTVAASALPVIPATATSTNLQEDPELPKHRIGELESSIGFYQAIELVEHSLLYSKQSKYQTYVHGEWECRGIIMPSLVGRMQTRSCIPTRIRKKLRSKSIAFLTCCPCVSAPLFCCV